jgi:Ca2+-binding RTX toxin-like protein
MTTITIAGGSYDVAAGVTLNFVNENAFLMDAGATDPTLTIEGVVNDTLTTTPQNSFFGLVGIQIGASTFYDNPVIISATGVLNVTSTVPGVEIFGYDSGSWSPPFTNDGTFRVSGNGDAVGLQTYDVKPFPFTNHGVFDVTSTAGRAEGIELANGGVFQNSGDIEVSGHTGAVAVATAAHTESFDNTGTIHAVSDAAGAAVAVSWYFGVFNEGWSNEGVIQGDVALTAGIYSIDASTTINYANSGTMLGAVQLTSNDDDLTNSGTITGAITMGAGNDTIGNTGVITGQIDLGVGNDLFDGLTGTAASDIIGNVGDDTIHAGQGADTLDGGAGSDLLIGGKGAQALLGGDGADTLDAVYNNTQVEGGAGDDLIKLDGEYIDTPLALTNLDGGDGDDSFVVYAFPRQALTIDGGTGHNTLEMHYFGTDSAPILLNLNGVAASGAWVGLNLQSVDIVGHVASVVGSDADDTITAPGTINGGGGADTLTGSDSQTEDLSFNLMALTGDDTIGGGAGDDSISGLGGNDLLIGGAGGDTLAGGAGANVFQFNQTGDSPAANALQGHLQSIDHVTDWSNSDFLQFSGDAVATSANYQEITAATYDSAYNAAQAAFTDHAVNYTVAQVGADVIVFAPQEGLAVDLVGRTLADISLSNVGPTAPTNGSQAPPPIGGGGGGGGGAVGTNIPTDGPDHLTASASQTAIDGGSGADTISGAPVDDYLRGGDGDDSIAGGAAFDDINGNKGADTIDGGSGGSDWLVGGQGDDNITAHTGGNILYGNLGNDTLHSGNGADIVRGGQGDDVIFAGSGNQFLSGDRGDDTITAGAGNDTIHSSQDAGIDRILNYNPGHDIVQLDPGTTYSVSQVGADTVISMGGNNQVVLVGVQMSTLAPGWIFEG